jgi:hypothetical protein
VNSQHTIEDQLWRAPPANELLALEIKFAEKIAELDSKLRSAPTPHRAVGLWWAKTILRPHLATPLGELTLDLVGPNEAATIAARFLVIQEAHVLPHISAFADEVENLSQDLGEPSGLSVDYHADRTLVAAAAAIDMQVDSLLNFPAKSHTVIMSGRAVAAVGGAPSVQIWPPLNNSDLAS